MSRIRSLILIIVVLALFGSVAAQSGTYYVSGDTRVNVRATPSVNAGIVTTLNPGEVVQVIGTAEGDPVSGITTWYRISVGTREGYIHSVLVSPGAPPNATPAPALPDPPANPNASPEARAVLEYLYQLPSRESNRVISGQFGSYGEGTSRETAEAQLDAIFEQAQLYPALTGMDYQRWDINNANDFSEPNGYLIDQWRLGALVTVSWHAGNPWTGGMANDWENADTAMPTDTRPVTELLAPGNAAHQRWMDMLDNVADGLQELEDAGVVVIWRPLHEMNGGWAWWHRQTADNYGALWRHMFDYFTNVKGLDNLLWAYSPMMNFSRWDYRAIYHYPGDEYVDLVGLDKYMAIGEDPLQLNRWGEYDDLVSTGKPIGLFEFGPLPADATGADTVNYDYANLIRDIRALYPKIVLFQAWEWVWQIGSHSNAEGLLNDSWVITRGELPNWSTLAAAAEES